ncbi:lytic murein transglycosylase [Bordetella genomosp. 9]|uniref:Type III effector n=1 Tax=Bordetella genomosp. 9 TaxID=1416803 RepID=A0A1W6Z100_9BORD|nr:lytic murein transglycosylase [Bordetella genomosp. 9]ARP87020.1 type III effector [Bordetella genomosp. 9]ARP91009.1 type III effector [Bordetella genomosp. 9]
MAFSRFTRLHGLTPSLRRWAPVLALAATGIAGCAAPATGAPEQAANASAGPVASIPQDQDRDPAQCLASLRATAPANGISVADFDRYTQGSKLLAVTVAAAKAQPEGKETWWDYIAKTVDDQRVQEGMAVLDKSRAALGAIDDKYQIDSEPLVAIFGIETNYGTQLGKVDVLNAWLTRACTEQKPLWVKNVYASVRLLRDGTVDRDRFIGSWSGAFGMTQFIPTSFYELAADGDGDGRIDLYNSLPDALASTANHLLKRRATWSRGMPAVIEVRLPPAIAATLPAAPDAEIMNRDDRRSLAQWAEAGVTRADGSPLRTLSLSQPWDGVQAYLFAPTGSQGPAFLATRNFDAILHYNQSHKYALAVSLLTNRLKGDQGLVAAWPTDDPGLSRAQIKALQTMLAERGYDIGVPDGIPGSKTRQAVAAEQQRLGLPQDGRVGYRIFSALQRQ